MVTLLVLTLVIGAIYTQLTSVEVCKEMVWFSNGANFLKNNILFQKRLVPSFFSFGTTLNITVPSIKRRTNGKRVRYLHTCHTQFYLPLPSILLLKVAAWKLTSKARLHLINVHQSTATGNTTILFDRCTSSKCRRTLRFVQTYR